MTTPPIACATDLGPSGAIAADWAAYFGKRLGLPVRLLHARGAPDPDPETAVPEMMREVAKVYNERIAAERATRRRSLAAQAERIRARGVEVDPQILEGRASEVLALEFEREPVSLAIVGPHTRIFDEQLTENAFLPFGTTAERIAHEGNVPVFVARAAVPVEAHRLQLIFDLEHAENSPGLEESAKEFADKLGASFLAVDHQADIRAMPRDESTMNVLVTRASGRAGMVLTAPATRLLRRYPFPVLTLPNPS